MFVCVLKLLQLLLHRNAVFPVVRDIIGDAVGCYLCHQCLCLWSVTQLSG